MVVYRSIRCVLGPRGSRKGLPSILAIPSSKLLQPPTSSYLWDVYYIVIIARLSNNLNAKSLDQECLQAHPKTPASLIWLQDKLAVFLCPISSNAHLTSKLSMPSTSTSSLNMIVGQGNKMKQYETHVCQQVQTRSSTRPLVPWPTWPTL